MLTMNPASSPTAPVFSKHAVSRQIAHTEHLKRNAPGVEPYVGLESHRTFGAFVSVTLMNWIDLPPTCWCPISQVTS